MELSKKSVLIVDDMDAIRKISADQLRRFGIGQVYQADNGAKALTILKNASVDLIISDWNMPVMTGIELLSKVRQSSKWQHLPFLMITAEAARERVSTAIAEGVTDIVIKPFNAITLQQRVVQCLSGHVSNRSHTLQSDIRQDDANQLSPDGEFNSESSPKDKIPHRPSVLVVDDTTVNLTLIGELLKDDYQVKLALQGSQALEIAQSDSPPDLILLDIMMPEMDGFEVLKQLREHPQSAHIPVIFVTALTEDKYQLQGLGSGAVDYISKPIQPELLKLRVRNLMAYVQMHKRLQSDFDNIVTTEKLKQEVQQVLQHDLKGPIAGLMTLLEQISQDPHISKSNLENTQMAEDMSLQLLNMINMSSELYKIETGRFQLQAKPFSLADLLQKIIEVLKKTFQSKLLLIYLDYEEDGDEDYLALGDKSLSYSMLFNLLKNACEAAPSKTRVSISLLRSDADDSQQHLQVKIQNIGVVPAEIRETFWQKYVSTGKESGTGIGTYSAKLLVQAQHGEVALAVDDDANTTTVNIILPSA
ncbi:hybrid sensor histidine kinase/response regulator [Shewanella olleyana]|uniref:ATP-binding response regulator n=1 Tax=Shewanella olleyana TaxID=135626 RepID=UPI00200E05D8|nr:hybrid sensor histidine kinase/response regulator [Shewanella olleyana]MCL1065279.1 hybrid sensor histidine kinase/response regulator [Shewanella olleyana]